MCVCVCVWVCVCWNDKRMKDVYFSEMKICCIYFADTCFDKILPVYKVFHLG